MLRWSDRAAPAGCGADIIGAGRHCDCQTVLHHISASDRQ